MKVYYKGDYPVPLVERYLCKQSAVLNNEEFVAGKYYDVSEIQVYPAVVINHIYFYFRDHFEFKGMFTRSVFLYDYFYTEQEIRKMKLEELNKEVI